MAYQAVPTGAVTLASLTGLTNKQIVFGGSTGLGDSDAAFTYDKTTHDQIVSASESGGTVAIAVANTSNTASSAAQYRATVAGSSANNPFSTWTISGGQSYSAGIDNSTSGDPFVLSAGATVPAAASALGLTINAAGEIGVGAAPVASSQFLIQGASAMAGGIISSGITTVTGSFWRIGCGTTRVIRIGGYGSSESGNTTYGEPKNNTAEISTTSLTQIAFLTGTTTLQAIIDNGKPGISVVPTGVQRCWVGGTLKTIQSDTGNVGAGEDTLHSYTLAASMLSADGQSVEIETAVSFAANANSKRVRVYFGATVLLDSTATVQNGGVMVVRARVTRTAAATQRAWAAAANTAAVPLFVVGPTYTTPAETLSGTVLIKVTGEAVSDNDVVNVVTRIKWDPALN